MMTVIIFQNYMKKLVGQRSVPQVFIAGKHLGGGDDTVAAAKNGQLEKMLLNCPLASGRQN